MTIQELQEYREKVFSAAEQRDGSEPIFNGTLEHASVVMEAMFKHANERISILTGWLNPDVYAQLHVLVAARDFVLYHERAKVEILIEEYDEWMINVHPLILVLNRVAGERTDAIQVKGVPRSVVDSYNYHFMVMDDDCFRYEDDRNKPAAIALFGNRDSAMHLRGIFDVIWDRSGGTQ